jgi:glycosyltransferase involved in cell wall biosynthesis
MVIEQNVKVPVSVIVPVKNEAEILQDCLQHLQWADEVFVVDSQSSDQTSQIAERMGAHVVQFHFNGVFPKKKNWAIQSLPFRNDWVLIVDADEHIPAALAAEIASAVARSDVNGYYINRRFLFLGKWIKRCGYYPSWNLRLFRRGTGHYERVEAPLANAGDNEVHEHVILDGHADYLRADMLHYAYPSIRVWVEKHNRYSGWEAHVAKQLNLGRPKDRLIGRRLHFKRLLKRFYLRLPFRFVFRFFYAYVLRLGFLDGRPGFIMSVLLSFYDFLAWSKSYELRLVRTEFVSGNALRDLKAPANHEIVSDEPLQ